MNRISVANTYSSVKNREELIQCLTEFKEHSMEQGWHTHLNFTNQHEQANQELYMMVGFDCKISRISLFQADYWGDNFDTVDLPKDTNKVIEEVESTFKYPLTIQMECSQAGIKCDITEMATLW